MDETAIRKLAEEFVDCAEVSDFDGLIALYAPDAQVWNNGDQRIRTPRELADLLRELDNLVTDKKYANRQLHVFPGGFVQRQMICGTRKSDGKRIEVPACLVAEIVNGKVARTFDYFDSARVSEFYS